MIVTICRKAHFNAAHRLYNSSWSKEKNFDVYGPCSYENYHGHNYELTLELTGEVDPEIGYVYDLKKLQALIDEYVILPLDHRNLNLDVPAFKTVQPSTEYLAKYIYDILREQLAPKYAIRILLQETPRNGVIYPPFN